MQDSLFDEDGSSPLPALETSKRNSGKVKSARADAALVQLASRLPSSMRLGTSSWSYPGWAGVVWDREYSEQVLARHGLAAYARHPLLRAVSIDRTFYKPLEATRFALYAAQTPDDFRFTVKAPAMVTDAMLRDEEGRGMRSNPFFLDVTHATNTFIEPLVQGVGSRLGAAVLQFSPLPLYWLERMPELIARLHEFLRALPPLGSESNEAVIAIEVRDAAWLTTEFAEALRDAGATYCLGLHAKMPSIQEQLPILRALWPTPLVCRWNLNARHGAFGYSTAATQYEPYDKLIDQDVPTRMALARVIAGVTSAGKNALVTISNEAEGCAPLSVFELAKAVLEIQELTNAKGDEAGQSAK